MNANTLLLSRPEATEYAPYYDKYISLIRGTDIIEILEKQLQDFPKFFSGRTEKDGELRYAAEKWSVKQVLGHLNDTERVFSYRALRISRNDKTPIEGYEQDDYVRYGPFEQCRPGSGFYLCSQCHHIAISQPEWRGMDSQRCCQ